MAIFEFCIFVILISEHVTVKSNLDIQIHMYMYRPCQFGLLMFLLPYVVDRIGAYTFVRSLECNKCGIRLLAYETCC